MTDATGFDRDAVLDEMRAILIDCAKRRQTITYSELAQTITSARMHHRAPIFHRLLDHLMTGDDPDEPSLATLVVRKDSGIPGMGYFAIAGRDGEYVPDPEAYWKERFDELCAYWADAGTHGL
jgi:hypothetical protein